MSEIITGSGLMDRPELFLANVVGGHLRAAAATLNPGYDVAQLSPEERKKLSARLGLTGPAASLVDITTNPMVLVPLAATLMTRLPGAAAVDATSATGAWSRFATKYIPLISAIAPAMTKFNGTKLYPIFSRVASDMKHWMSKWYGTTGLETEPGFLATWDEAVKTNFGGKLTKEQAARLYATYTKLHTPGQGAGKVWQPLIGRLQDALDETDPGKAYAKWTKLNTGAGGQVLQGEDYITPEKAIRLIGKLKAPMTGLQDDPKFAPLKQIIKKSMDNVYGDTMADKKHIEDIVEDLPHLFGAPDTGWTEESITEMVKDLAPKLDDYLPMLERTAPEKQGTGWIKGNRRGGASRAVLEHLLKGESTSQTTKRILVRENGMVPQVDEFLAAGGDPEVAAYLKLRVQQGDRQFSLDPHFSMVQYIENMARTMSFAVRNQHGTKASHMIEEELSQLREGMYPNSPMDKYTQVQMAKYADEVIVPSLRGRMTPTQTASSMFWNATKASIARYFREPDGVPHKVLGARRAAAWADNLDNSPTYSQANISAKVTGYLHASTLSANPVAASFNLLTILTNLGASVGWGSAAKGFGIAMKEVGDYLSKRAGGMKADEAFRAAFPEYHIMALELGSTERQAFMETLEGAYRSGYSTSSGGLLSRGVAKFQELTNIFGATEHINRLTAYHASKDYALKSLKAGETMYDPFRGGRVTLDKHNIPVYARQWARDNVYRTQFGSDILQKPGVVADWNPVLRQFTTFPLRQLDYVAHAPAATWARLALASGVAYTGAKEMLGADISRGLLFGGLPLATDPSYTPFAPFPLVPPALQLAGGAALASIGQTEYLQRSLPLLVPGGIPAARAISMVPGVGRTVGPIIGRQYMDDTHPTPDGRYPVYTSTGSLVGNFTSPQLVARAMGLPNPDATTEQQVMKFMIANRDRIAGMKRSYMDALYNNDAADAQRIREQYETAYPNTGGLPVKPSDIKALHMRRDISRMERVLETMPQAARGQFLASIAVSMGADPEGFMGLLKNGIIDGTTLDRDPYRAYNLSQTKERVNKGLHGVGLREKMNAVGMPSTYEANRARDSGTYLGGQSESYLP